VLSLISRLGRSPMRVQGRILVLYVQFDPGPEKCFEKKLSFKGVFTKKTL